jgi:hypothetical protein
MASGPRKGDCRQCWEHGEMHKNWLGLKKEDDCQPCLDHMVNGHPDHMIVR